MPLSLDRIQSKTAQETPCSLTLEVQLPSEILQDRHEKTLLALQKKAHLPGFRIGKAPLEMIRQNFADRAKTEAVEDLLREVIPVLLEDKKVQPVDTPQVQKIDLNEQGALLFTLYVERSPEFAAKNYQSIKLQRKVKEITAADVEKELDQLRQRNATLQFSQAEVVTKDHFAVIDYQGTLDGNADADLKGENQMIDMTAPQTIPGFAEGILGLKRGQSKEVPVTFPADYSYKKLAGKPVVFQITLQDIKEKVLPNADDELAKDFGYEGLQALKDDILKSLNDTAQKQQQGDLERQIIEHLDKENPIPVPDSLIARQAQVMVDQFLRGEYGQAMQNTSKEEQEQKRKELMEKVRPEAEKMVRTSYLLEDITRQQNLQASGADLDAEMERAKQANPEKVAEIEKYFAQKRSNILNRLTESKVFQYLKDQAQITDIKE